MSLNQLLDSSTREGEAFYREFFRTLDGRVPNSAIQPNSKILWNGTPFAGADAFQQMIQQVPPTEHEVTGYNVHPFPTSTPDALYMMIDVSGRCKFGDERNKDIFAFEATLVVRKLHGALILQQMDYRLVYKPTDATVEM